MPITPQHPTTLPDQLAQKIGKLIDQGLLKAGQRLPSIRAAAIEYGVAKNTQKKRKPSKVASVGRPHLSWAAASHR